jgi:hypothetical protein
MDRPIHDVLDGTRARDQLSAPEREELAALESAIGSAMDPLRSAPVPDLTDGIMARISELPARQSPWTRVKALGSAVLEWIWAPRDVTVRLRPAYAMAALAAVLALVAVPSGGAPEPVRVAAVIPEPAAPQVYVQFRLEATGAANVALAGSFTGWKPAYQLREATPGTWSILLPLQPGVHDYAFVVDGTDWVADPHALHISDGFGGVNSRIALPPLPTRVQHS